MQGENDPRLVELGALLSTDAAKQRGGPADKRLTIADSTGVGASDLCIAEAAYRALVPGVGLDEGSAPPPSHVWRRPADAMRSRM